LPFAYSLEVDERMEIDFQDARAALVETDRAAESRYPIEVINSLRQKLHVIRQAPDERTLRGWKSLHYEKLAGREDQRSIRINKQWRLVFTIDTQSRPNKITVLGVEDYHR
jgi:proteic killer suppression protein